MSAGRVDLSLPEPEISIARLQEADRDLGARFCRSCGCTDLHACEGSCWWVDEDLCSSCRDVDPGLDPGLELPEYPPPPFIDGHVDLDQLEGWHLERRRRAAELDAAMVEATARDAPAEMFAIATRMAQFESRHIHDVHLIGGWLAGRSAYVLGGARLHRSLDVVGYAAGIAAGLAASARRLDMLGLTGDAAHLRAISWPESAVDAGVGAS